MQDDTEPTSPTRPSYSCDWDDWKNRYVFVMEPFFMHNKTETVGSQVASVKGLLAW